VRVVELHRQRQLRVPTRKNEEKKHTSRMKDSLKRKNQRTSLRLREGETCQWRG
jgi:hypothetical protein